MTKQYNTLNEFMVAARGYGDNSLVTMLMPPAPSQALTQDEALVLAAYLVALSGHEPKDLEEVLQQLG